MIGDCREEWISILMASGLEGQDVGLSGSARNPLLLCSRSNKRGMFAWPIGDSVNSLSSDACRPRRELLICGVQIKRTR